jgi:outer membrane protein assembly factor BamB
VEPLAAGDPRNVGGYRLQARLGAGGMGRVFLGFSAAGRPVAVKVVHAELAADPAFRARFGREVASARAVSGAFTAPVVAAGPGDDPPWLATVFVAGPSLAEAVSVAGPLPEGAAWRLAAGLAEALAEIHGRGLVHRDLKPANVLLALDGPRVIDFGISRALEATVMTATGLVVGTPAFMSPEQAADGQVGPASDVFSLASLLVFAVTGTGPFGHGPAPSLLYRVVHAEPALDRVPAGLRELTAACLAKDPAARPALAQVMDAITAGAPPLAASLASFWPGTLADLIRAHQARLDAQLARPAAPAPAVAALASAAAAASAPAPPPAPAPAAPTPAPAPAAPPPRPQDEPTVTGQPAAPPAAFAGAPRSPLPALPADLPWGGALGPASSPGRARHGLTRRRVLAGLAGVAAVATGGLAAAAWELSRSIPPPPPGTELWSSSAGNGPYRPPVIADGILYFPGAAPGTGGPIYALQASDGETIWSSGVGGGADTLLVVAGGVVYFGGNDNRLYALRADTGSKIWATGAGHGAATDPVVSGGIIYFGGNDDVLYALRANTGKPVWTAPIAGGAVTEPIAAGDVLYVGSSEGKLYALRADHGTRIWVSGLPDGLSSASTVAGDFLYVESSDWATLYALHTSNGHQIWTADISGLGGPNAVPSSPVPAEGIVYVGTASPGLEALSADSGSPVWATGTGGGPATNPVVADGVVYFGAVDERVYALRANNGAPIWNTRIGRGASTDPVLAAGVLYFAGNDHRLHAVRT